MAQHLLFIICFYSTSKAIETSLIEWYNAGCNVVLSPNGFTYHRIYAYQHTKQIISSYPSNIHTSQCLYHTLSYSNTSMNNMTLTQYDVDNECPLDCIDWYNGCTECLCLNDTNSSLCNLNIINSETCSTSYINHHCQMSKNELDRHGYDISLLTWFSIVNVSPDYEIYLPLSMSNELTLIVNKFISEYTTYTTRNTSCTILYPYNYTNYYSFNNINNTFNINQLFNILPHFNQTYSFNNTDIVNSSILFSTEFNSNNSNSNIPSISPTISPTISPIILTSMNEYDGNYYNYMPQCTFSFINKQTAMEFMIDFRNHSNIFRQNLHLILTNYINNISILLTTDDINETLYSYTHENEHLYIEYINNTDLLRIDESDSNDSDILSNINNYELILNKSLYSIQLNSFGYYFGNISSPLTTTLSPTKSPTKPRDCWFDGKFIEHNTTHYQNNCYFVECNNGQININDKYCDAQCYNKTRMINMNVTDYDCCKTPDGEHCGEDNDDCPDQNDCQTCVGNDRICSWIGDHCSAVCVGVYCWNNGQCPKIIIIRLHIKGITVQQLQIYEGLLNHAIAESLDITENLIKNYYPTQTPNINIIEIKKTISLKKSDEHRIPNILSAEPNDEYVQILNVEIGKAFSNVPTIGSNIEIIDVEYGGFEGENNNKNRHTLNNIEFTNDAFIILLICGTLVMITICALCIRYPILSYCCCCIPISIRRQLKNCTRDNCCQCCEKFSFGVLYDDNMNDLIKRKREERRRNNLIIRNEIIEEQYHLNENIEEEEEKDLEEEKYHQLDVEINVDEYKKKKHKKNRNSKGKKSKKHKKKKKKKKKRKKDKKRKSLSEFEFETYNGTTVHDDIMEQNEMDISDEEKNGNTQEIAMTNVRNVNREMLYHDRQRDLIEEDETNTIL